MDSSEQKKAKKSLKNIYSWYHVPLVQRSLGFSQEKIGGIKDIIPKYYGLKTVVTFDNCVIMWFLVLVVDVSNKTVVLILIFF